MPRYTIHQKQPRLNTKSANGPFAFFIKKRRMDMGLTQQELSELSGLSLPFIQDVERGFTNLRLAKLMQLVEALGGEIEVRERVIDQAKPFE